MKFAVRKLLENRARPYRRSVKKIMNSRAKSGIRGLDSRKEFEFYRRLPDRSLFIRDQIVTVLKRLLWTIATL